MWSNKAFFNTYIKSSIMNKLSKHLSFKEATYSKTAETHGINNIPFKEQLTAMKLAALAIFEPCRMFIGGALAVTSFFRSKELNTHPDIGGSETSDHPKGCAIDMNAQVYGKKTNAELFHFIKDNLSFDQLIWEYGDENEPKWIHCSYRSEDENRQQVLRASKVNGKTKYTIL